MGLGEGEETNLLGKLGRLVQTERGRWTGVQRYTKV